MVANTKKLRSLTLKLFSLLITLLVTLSASFFLLRLVPGSPFDQDRAIAPEIKANLEKQYGLDKPLIEQYWNYSKAVLRGDLGPSLKYTSRSVTDILADAFPVSLSLGILALILSLFLGLGSAILAVLKPNSLIASALMALSSLSLSLPSFVIAAILVSIFGLQLAWLPVALLEGPEYLILPVITLAIAPSAYIMRISYSALSKALSQNYIRTAFAKGLAPMQVLWKHALPNSLLPILTVIGPVFAILITGSFVVEHVFALPGMAKYFVTAFINRDYFLVSGVLLIFSLILLTINSLIELAVPFLDPRDLSRNH